jgi:hypothetical protein
MSARKPLVIVSGQIEQLQSGDTLDAVSTQVSMYNFTNADIAPHAAGDIVYIFSADNVKKATANASGTTKAIAIATTAITNGTSGAYQTDGVLAGLIGLTAGATYFLSDATPGLLTVTAPTSVGSYVVRIGVAVSTTELLIDIQEPILL